MHKHSPQTPEKKEETKSMVDNLAVLGSVKNPQHMRIADEILTKSLQQRNEFFKSRHTFKDVFVWNQESKVSVNGRSSHTTIVYNDKLYVFGGMDNQYPNQFYCSDDLLIYDIDGYDYVALGMKPEDTIRDLNHSWGHGLLLTLMLQGIDPTKLNTI